MYKLLAIFAFAVAANAQEKVYLSQENIALHNHQILVGKGNTWIPIPRLSVDENGFYVIGKDLNSFCQWTCGHCGAENWIWDDTCWVCGRDRDE